MKINKIYQSIQLLRKKKVKDKICFIHIPKCGGSSIRGAILKTFGFTEYIFKKNFVDLDPAASLKAANICGDDIKEYRQKLLTYYLSNPRYKYLGGHFYYNGKAFQKFGQEWKFITILRHPVDQWFSQYFYDRYKKPEHCRIDLDLETFLESERAINMGRSYVDRLTDSFLPNDMSSPEAIEQAITHLNNFALVGILEEINLFALNYQRIFGARLLLEHDNINPVDKSNQKEHITDKIKDKVEELCIPNMRIYEAAIKHTGATVSN